MPETIDEQQPGFDGLVPSDKQRISREAVIEAGLRYLRESGTDSICKVCISHAGSCCIDCLHLQDRVGCQRRNTGCTAWLCGFHNFLLYELDQLEAWNRFWDEVPGQDYRTDETPAFLYMSRSLSAPDFRLVSEAFASDLEELAVKHVALGFIFTLREKLDKQVERAALYRDDPRYSTEINRRIQELSYPFYRFRAALHDYRLRAADRDGA
ncbi:hypothetical protein [Paenibacillus glycinis]|uniref:DNA mismatch repair protein n=1 Tax=Paenibacillus glycinis TaxID=2697035 RepID=A0ABW9XWQ2_9BACL|nr:hypothetical protein [Paenibacillus glycinis]NBD27142.1 hypothetical protein [Paenibacillus glycinis]